MVFQKVVVIDARDHMLGRLASVVSKELLSGQAVVVVRCEQVCVSGSMIRNEMKWARFLHKRTAPNPKCGPFHHVAPSRILFRTIRGMVPHKTNRGATAMAHLKCFDGIPAPYDTMKKMVVPVALRVNRLRPGRNFTVLGELSHKNGWKYKELVKRLEATRIAKSAEFYAAKKAATAKVGAAKKSDQFAAVNAELAAGGFM
jgi:large subunit ribosomal protein L13Ae